MKDIKTWCVKDEHTEYERYPDFNDWLDGQSDEAAMLSLESAGVNGFKKPSKMLFIADINLYRSEFIEYRDRCRREALSFSFLEGLTDDDHWYNRNVEHLNQLVNVVRKRQVVPFVGAGVSQAAGYPTWKDHLRQQGRTAGIESKIIEDHLEQGRYETVISEIEKLRNRDVFVGEVRDAFSKQESPPETTAHIVRLVDDTILTTNYDNLIEKAIRELGDLKIQVVNAKELPKGDHLTVVKIHGSIENPLGCILSSDQYDASYGKGAIDISLPIPKLLKYQYLNSSLIFVGCSLNHDRTIEVFKEVKRQNSERLLPQHFSIEQVPENVEALIERNAELANLGITPIWFEPGQYQLVDKILIQVFREVIHNGGFSHKPQTLSPSNASGESKNSANSNGSLVISLIKDLASSLTRI